MIARTLVSLALVLTPTLAARAITTSYSSEAAFLAAVPPAEITSFDFETGSGFPAGGAGAASSIGTVGGVAFSGITYTSAPLATSGVQVMAGIEPGFLCCFGVAAIDFTGLATRPYAFGFSGLDLTLGEIIRVSVEFDDDSVTSFSVALGGAPEYTPIFFGIVDDSRTIRFAQIFGAETGAPDSATRAWAIDDLRIATIPEPGTAALLAMGLGLLAVRRRS